MIRWIWNRVYDTTELIAIAAFLVALGMVVSIFTDKSQAKAPPVPVKHHAARFVRLASLEQGDER